MSGDQAMRDLAASMPVPEFETTAFTTPSVPLGEARVAIVTSAALHRPSDDPFTATDTSFRTLAAGDRDFILGHWSPNFDRAGITADLNVVYPIDRLHRLDQHRMMQDNCRFSRPGTFR